MLTLVGYHGKGRFVVKGAWGEFWGEDGFVYVDKSTGVCNNAVYVTIKEMTL